MNVVYPEIMPRFGEMLTEQAIPHDYVSTGPDGTEVYYSEAGHLAAINTARAGYDAWKTAKEAAEAAFTAAILAGLNASAQGLIDIDADYASAETAQTASTSAATTATTNATAAGADAGQINLLTSLIALVDPNSGYVKKIALRQQTEFTMLADLLTRVAALEARNRSHNRWTKWLIQIARQLKGKTT